MSRMFHSFHLFVLSCLFLTFECQKGQILPPQNVSAWWKDDFEPGLSWTPPQHSMTNCNYHVSVKNKDDCEKNILQTTSWHLLLMMEGGHIHWSVQTVCNGSQKSKPEYYTVVYPELVRNLMCFLYSSKQARCQWLPDTHVPDLHFFYQLVDEVRDSTSELRECSSYTYTNDTKTGCDLDASLSHAILILFNATLNNTLVRNTFRKETKNDVRLPPLKWTVTKSGNKFNISWMNPGILDEDDWKFRINYTECNDKKSEMANGTSKSLVVVSHCEYRIAIRAESEQGQTEWSDEKYFAADKDPLVHAAVIIPVVIAALAVVTFVCCRKNKDNIFPKIPEPRNLLSDISDNNNESTVGKMYVPAEEEENCKITLVIDPQISKPDC